MVCLEIFSGFIVKGLSTYVTVPVITPIHKGAIGVVSFVNIGSQFC